MAEKAVLSVRASAPSVVGGKAATFLIDRKGDMSAACAVEWACDALNGILSFDPSDVTLMVAIPTSNMPEQREDHRLTLTLSNPLGAELGTASATMTVAESDGGVVSVNGGSSAPADKKRPKYPPEPQHETTRNVPEDYPTVMAAYQDAPPGTTISVKPGVNCGELLLSRDLDPDNPVILRSRDRLGALLDKRVRCTGKGHWLHGFKQTLKVTGKGDGGIVVDADFITLTKMEIQSPHGITSAQFKRADVRIGWCYFSGKNTSTDSISNIFFAIPNGNHYSKPSDGPCRIYIYCNDFDDDGPRPSGVAMEDHCIYFGDSKPKGDDVVCMEDVELDHNLIRESNQRVRGFYMKRGAYLFQNSLLGAKYNWGIRHGGNARIEANIAKGSAKLILNGKGHKVYNNSWEQRCDLYAGSSKNGGNPLYQAAGQAELDMNEGRLNIGYITDSHQLDISQGGRVDHCTIWKHIGPIEKVAVNFDSSAYIFHDQPKGAASYLERVLLTPANVGVAG